jgi:UDP-N-acetylglucosamine:LPS N-acetylglucosamine transferase
MAWDKATMKVSPATYAAVTAIKQELEAGKQRQVTYSETLDEMAKAWRAAQLAVTRAEA